MKGYLKDRLINWLMTETPNPRASLSDFDRLRHVLHPCDVLLIEGRSRISRYIRRLTGSPWSHAALYVGHIQDVEDPELKRRLVEYCPDILDDQLIIESVLGLGTIVSSIKKYSHYHIRIARPGGVSHQDAQRVIAHAIERLGSDYDVSNILELATFFMPWWLLGLFVQHHPIGVLPSNTNKEICSSMIAEAFQSIHFPILPLINAQESGEPVFTPTHPRLFAPCDFDFSPFFEIVKYPIVGMTYGHLPWAEAGVYDYHRR
jgi:hypothetical protein